MDPVDPDPDSDPEHLTSNIDPGSITTEREKAAEFPPKRLFYILSCIARQ